jgi:translocator protein
MKRFAWLLGWIVLCLAAGAVGAIVSGPDAWYQSLNKPTWTPPSWVFAPVWTTLYILMAIAAWQVWEQRSAANVRTPIALFLVQLALNAAWTWIFFGLHRPDWAFFELVVLWLAVVATAATFYRIRPMAALLLLPYLGWTTFAAALNGAIWLMNRN